MSSGTSATTTRLPSTFQSSINPVLLENALLAGATLSIATPPLQVRQQVKMNPSISLSPKCYLSILKKCMTFQIGMKMTQIYLTVNLERWLAKTFPNPKWNNIALSYCVVATAFQPLLYNNITATTVQHALRKTARLSFVDIINHIRVGFFTSAIREYASSGMALAFAGRLNKKVAQNYPTFARKHPTAVKLNCAIFAGCVGGFITQWIHNVNIKAMHRFNLNKRWGTLTCLKRTFGQHGWKMFVKGAPQRVPLIALVTVIGNFTYAPLFLSA